MTLAPRSRWPTVLACLVPLQLGLIAACSDDSAAATPDGGTSADGGGMGPPSGTGGDGAAPDAGAVDGGGFGEEAGIDAGVDAGDAGTDAGDAGADAATCTTMHSVSGVVAGLTGAGLVLQLNGAGDLPVAEDGAFMFTAPLDDCASFEVSVATRPTGQYCLVRGGSGVVAGSDVTGVDVQCVASFRMLKNLNTAGAGSDPADFIDLGGRLVFSAVRRDVAARQPFETDGTQEGTQMLADTGGYSTSPFPMFQASPSLVFFRGGNGKLWRIKGPPPLVIQDLGFDTNGEFAVLGGKLYLDGYVASGLELYALDLDADTPALVHDIEAGTGSSNPNFLTAVGGRLFFAATQAGDVELWMHDPAGPTTARVKDIETSGSSYPQGLTVIGSNLYFHANAAGDTRVWTSDGSEGGTVSLGGTYSYPGQPVELGGLAFFAASNGTDYVLFKEDGMGGAVQVGTDYEAASDTLMQAGSRVFFLGFAADDTGNAELWATDGTDVGTARVADIRPGPESSSVYQFTKFGSSVVFVANDGTAGNEPWISDGTEAGTERIIDLRPGPQRSDVEWMRDVGGTLYFGGDADARGDELWKSDGTAAGTSFVADINPGDRDSNPQPFTPFGARLAFSASGDRTGTEFVVSDYTTPGTTLLDVAPGENQGLGPQDLAVVGDRIFFEGYLSGFGQEPWTSDGTALGTSMLVDLNPGSGSSGIDRAVSAGSTVYFAGRDADGTELWATDGTAPGTRRVKDIEPGAGSSGPRDFAVTAGFTVFVANTTAQGDEPWVTDGTEMGTKLLGDINTSGGSDPAWVTAVGAKVFFTANDGVARKLWVTDGTPGGTTAISDAIGVDEVVALGDRLLFAADDGVNGTELWTSDGTLVGTTMLKDLWADPDESSSPSSLTRAGDLVFFTADDGVNGRELWKTDGTAPGTVRVTDLVAGSGGWSMSEPCGTESGRLAFFRYDGSVYTLWMSDGTELGTLDAEVAFGEGPFRYNTGYTRCIGDAVLLAADDGSTGMEPWVLYP